jgi:hypothetical protein
MIMQQPRSEKLPDDGQCGDRRLGRRGDRAACGYEPNEGMVVTLVD